MNTNKINPKIFFLIDLDFLTFCKVNFEKNILEYLVPLTIQLETYHYNPINHALN